MAVAKAEGVQADSAPVVQFASDVPLFQMRWDEKYFENLDELEPSRDEMKALEALRQQLIGVNADLEVKEAEVQKRLASAQEQKRLLTDRLAKKRRDEQGVQPGYFGKRCRLTFVGTWHCIHLAI